MSDFLFWVQLSVFNKKIYIPAFCYFFESLYCSVFEDFTLSVALGVHRTRQELYT